MAVDKAPFKACKNRSYKKWILAWLAIMRGAVAYDVVKLSLEST
ncbi:hypothetical protein [Helicobacter zhangjianzhongii]|uniref:Uncharacterized protein n=1 Tax=Helicobacter zhangjianzhongii TaxID=2974574 RepID=A0ACC6FTX6_9HELI|nr:MULTISPECIES: hypothetical protein [unclassified Helicobacter]MDL0080460.1 hypothetical protein [Helicobacter sp. CPD2-1]MDL0082388.1 hypothetical protein [Helicobacter sp. XJK30-2]